MRLWPIPAGDVPALRPIFHGYFAELRPDDEPAEADPHFDLYWQETTTRFAYWFGGAKPSGFAFVRKPGAGDLDFELSEFCVLPGMRRRGIGSDALGLVLARHPGRWELSVLRTNAAGLAFWPMALAQAGVHDLRFREDDVGRDFRFTVAGPTT